MSLLLVGAFVASFVAALTLVFTSRWHGHVSMDSSFGIQKLHTEPTPRVGGVAIATGLLAACILAPPHVRTLLIPMLLAGIPAFVAGLVEDLTKAVAVRVRLVATMASGVLAWLLTGISMQDTGLWGLDNLLTYLPVSVAFTAFVVSGVANATNIIDGFNGLAAGVVVIMVAAMGIMSLQVGDSGIAALAFCVAAVALGFGAVNWPGGRIFMGDGGAYLLGVTVAWIAILLPMHHEKIHGWATLMACAYPVTEVLFSIRRRLKRHGHHPGQPDKCHLHHFIHRRVVRKVFAGSSKKLQNSLTGSVLWVLAALPSIWAVVFSQNSVALAFGLALFAFGYAAIYARLTQFVWCFQAATMQRRVHSAV